MANINVTISYNPGAASGSQWSLSGDNVTGTTIEVNDQGSNPIGWSIAMASGQPGSIAFNPTTGISMKTNSTWPGDPKDAPSGNANNWNAKLNNTLQSGDDPIGIYYTVNANYTSGNGGTPVPVSWDPEVEENPPAQILVKRRQA